MTDNDFSKTNVDDMPKGPPASKPKVRTEGRRLRLPKITFRNLGVKLISGFVVLAIVGGMLSFLGSQLTFEKVRDDSVPSLRVLDKTINLTGAIQLGVLEFVSTGEEEVLAELAESQAELITTLEELLEAADDPEEGPIFEEIVQISQEMASLAESVIESHTVTLDELESLQKLGEEAELVFEDVTINITAEIDRNIQEGDIEELKLDAIPSKDALSVFIGGTRLLQIGALEFVATGEQEAIDEFNEVEEVLEASEAELSTLFEADEPGEEGIGERINAVEEQVETSGRNIIASHTNTLNLFEQLQEAEVKLANSIAIGSQFVDEEIADAFASIGRNSILAALLVTVVSVILGVLITNTIVNPVSRLVEATKKFAAGELTARVAVTSKDEIGALALSFNELADQLAGNLEDLEERARALTISAEVSRRLSTIIERQQLVLEVVEQVQDAFNYYHAHIYLLDEASGDLVMAGGTGAAGRELLASGHKIAKGRGLVGRAAESNTVVLVPDVSNEPGWLPNRLLPDTQAEIAVPVATGARVLGVLDVQHDIPDGLNEDDARLLESIAGQVAVALQNILLFEEAQEKIRAEVQITEITQRIQGATSTDDILQVAARELGRALGAKRSTVHLNVGDPSDNGQEQKPDPVLPEHETGELT